MEDDFRFYNDYHMYREDPNVPDYNELQQSMEESRSMDGMQLAAGPSFEQVNRAAQNMPLETETQTTMRRMQEDQQTGVTGQIIPQDRTLREELAYRTQQALIQNLGIDNAKARKLAETIFGGESSGVPLGVGLTDFTPAVIPMAVQESGISAGKARESVDRGEYGRAAAEYGIGILQGAEAIPGVKLASKAAKKIGTTLAPAAGEMFETYAARTGLTNYITDPVKVYSGVMVQDIQPKRRLNTLVTKLESGRIDEQTYIENTKLLNEAMQKKPEKVSDADKVRGADEVTRRLLGALNPNAQVKLREPIVRFAKWLLDNNPQFGNELGISIKGTGEKGTAGGYASWDRVATIFADKANDATGVHEILHHTEQMMPIEVQNGITDEWTRSYLATYQKADPKVQLYLKEIPKAIAGDKKAQKTIFEGFRNGTLNYDAHYQFVNPSEFWAVNATRIMNSRYEAGSWIAKAKVWLGEFTEKAKGAFGVQSDSQVLRGLKAISKGKGELESDLLAEPINVSSSARRVKQQREQSQQRKRVAKGAAAVTAAGAALTGDEGQK